MSDIRIIVAQRGWNFVGRYSVEGDEIVITDAMVIRYWGTTHGLGQLAEDGPTPSTKLDPARTIRIHRLAVVFTMDADPAKWGEILCRS